MCESIAEGGQRCPGRRGPARALYRKTKTQADEAKKKRPRKVKDVDCSNSDCKNGVVTEREDGDQRYGHVVTRELCTVCGGTGYLNDAAGRIRSEIPKTETDQSEQETASEIVREMRQLAANGSGRAAVFLARTPGSTPAEIIAAAKAGNLPRVHGPCQSCVAGQVAVYGPDGTPTGTTSCIECNGLGHTDLSAA